MTAMVTPSIFRDGAGLGGHGDARTLPRPQLGVRVAPTGGHALARHAAHEPAPSARATANADDAPLLAILEAPLAPGETAHDGFRRKEAELGAAFAALPVTAARALHARLSAARPDDHLAARFGRLTIERRHRLLTFLADARRRAALQGGR